MHDIFFSFATQVGRIIFNGYVNHKNRKYPIISLKYVIQFWMYYIIFPITLIW